MSAPKGPDLCYVRGDTAPLTLIFKRSGVVIDLSVFSEPTFFLTVDGELAPADPTTTQQFKMEGSYTTDGTDGSIDFIPIGVGEPAKRTASEAYVVGNYFWEADAEDGSGRRVTFVTAGAFEVQQQYNQA